MARSITTRSTNPKIMDDNIKILDAAIQAASTPEASDIVYDNTDSGLTADDVQAAIDETLSMLKYITPDLGSIAGNSTKYLNVSPASTGILIFTGAENDLVGIAVVHAWSSDSVIKFIGAAPSKITVTKNVNKYAIANGSGNSALLFYINTRGAVPTLTIE